MDDCEDGIITKERLQIIIKSLEVEIEDETIDEIIKIADVNSDGKVLF